MGNTLLGICGSKARSVRTLAAVERALAEARASEPSLTTELLDLAALDLDMCDGRPMDQYGPATRATLAQIERADLYVVGTPIYRGSYTGALKNLFDLVPAEGGNEPLRGKAIGFMASGGSDHHFLMIEHELRPLAGFFGMYTAPTGVYLRSSHFEGSELTNEAVLAQLRGMVAQVLHLGRLRASLPQVPSAW